MAASMVPDAKQETTMSDTKDRVRIKSAITPDNNVLTLTLPGQTDIVFDRRKAQTVLRDYAEIHGFKQAIADCGALPAGSDGKVSIEARFEAMREKAAWFETGETWAQKGAGGGGVGVERLRLINALDRFIPKRAGQPNRDYVSKLSTKDVRSMLADARLAATLAAMDAEATAGVDTEALWAGLDEA